jgi:hypothetical protein
VIGEGLKAEADMSTSFYLWREVAGRTAFDFPLIDS